MKYYKYRNFNNIGYLFDIIINKRLYCSLASELNDPFEWYFKSDEILKLEEQEQNDNYKKNSYICSLSKTFSNNVMWAMYADEHRGCCLEIEVCENQNVELIDVKYLKSICSEKKSIKDVIKFKTLEWKNEKEVRALVESVDRPDIKVKITKVLLGLKVANVEMWEKVIHALDSKIEVRNITVEEIDNKKLKS